MKDRVLALSLASVSLSALLNLVPAPCYAQRVEPATQEAAETTEGETSAGTTSGGTTSKGTTSSSSSSTSSGSTTSGTDEIQQINDLISKIAGIDRAQRTLERETTSNADREPALAYNRRAIQEAEDKLAAMGPRAIPYLIDALNRTEREASEASERVLVRLGPQVVRPLIIAAADQRLTPSRGKHAASNVVRKLGGEAIGPLKEMLNGSSESQRLAAMRMLTETLPDRRYYPHYRSYHNNYEEGYIVPPEVITILCTACSDKSATVRKAAVETLGRIGPRNNQLIQTLSKTLRTDSDASVRRSAATALGDVGQLQSSEPSKQTVLALEFTLVNDEYEGTRLAAAKALGKMTNAPNAVAALMKGLNDPVQLVKDGSIAALQSFGPAAAPAVPVLIKCLNTPNSYSAEEVARTLSRIGPAAAPALPTLIKMAAESSNNHNSLRYSLAEACRSMGSKASPAVPQLIQMLKDHSNSSGRYQVIEALGAIGPAAASAEPALLEVAKSSPTYRSRVEEALKKIKGETATVPGAPQTDTLPRRILPRQQIVPATPANSAGDV